MLMFQESILSYLLETKTCFPSAVNVLFSSQHGTFWSVCYRIGIRLRVGWDFCDNLLKIRDPGGVSNFPGATNVNCQQEEEVLGSLGAVSCCRGEGGFQEFQPRKKQTITKVIHVLCAHCKKFREMLSKK